MPGASHPERIAEDHAALKGSSPPTSGARCASRVSLRPRRRCPSTD